jgi:hypothetical protein
MTCLDGTSSLHERSVSCDAENLEFYLARLEDHLVRPSPSLKFIFKYVTRTQPKPDFVLFQPEWSPIYLQSALTIVSLMQVSCNLIMHKFQQSLNEFFNDVLKTSRVILEFEERYKHIGCQVCKVLYRTISGRGKLRKSQRKSNWWDLFPEPDCVTSKDERNYE